MRLRTLIPVASGFLLLSGLACGGGSKSASATSVAPAATGLAYTNPTSTGWRFVKDGSSTSTRLVLNLVGPAGLMTRGVGFNLQAPEGVKFEAFANGLPIQDTGVYQLQAVGSADPTEPVAMTGGVKRGNLLSVGIYQKDRGQGAKDSGAALCQIALSLDATAHLSSGAALTLSVPKAKAIPEDIGAITDDQQTLDRKMRMTDLTIALGTLTAN
ncbi:MAG TPA: hypothetical protein VJ505_01195 [Holophagaceae bacterium]|nr:hypothetical protein [Holophagaceae bacterium]